jgi:hypothetical protein
MDTSQLPSQRSAGGADPLRLRGTGREHRVKVCVLALICLHCFSYNTKPDKGYVMPIPSAKPVESYL